MLDAQDLGTFFDGLVPYMLKRNDIAGGAVAVVKDGHVIFAQGYGYADVAKRTPVVADKTLFRIGSISKLFTLVMALRLEGDGVWQRVGREPSGMPFNSLVQLEAEAGRPRNPFINPGALVCTDILCTRYATPENAVVEFLRPLCGNRHMHYNRAVAASERRTSHRNAAMAHLIKSFGNLNNSVDEVLDAYCRHCAIEIALGAERYAGLHLPGVGVEYVPAPPTAATGMADDVMIDDTHGRGSSRCCRAQSAIAAPCTTPRRAAETCINAGR